MCYTTIEIHPHDLNAASSGNVFEVFHGEITDEMAFILIHLVITFTDCWVFFVCDGATLVFVRFMSWCALVLMLGCGSPALLFDVTASYLMFCGGRVVKVKLASRLHPPCCCCYDF